MSIGSSLSEWARSVEDDAQKILQLLEVSQLSKSSISRTKVVLTTLLNNLTESSQDFVPTDVRRKIASNIARIRDDLDLNLPAAPHRDQQVSTSLDQVCSVLPVLLTMSNALRQMELKHIHDAARAHLAQVESDALKITGKLEDAELHVDQIKSQATDAADSKLAQAYQVEADSQRTHATRWRRAAVTVLIIGAITAVYVAVDSTSADITVQQILLRVGSAVGIIVVGAFFESQQRMHRKREINAMSVVLRLRTLGLFTESLDESSRNRIRELVGNEIFAGRVGRYAEDDTGRQGASES